MKKDFYYRQTLVLLLGAFLLWLIFDYTNLDIYVSSLFYDFNTASWPYYNGFFTKTIGYDGIKNMLILYGIVLLSLLVYSYKNQYWQSKRTMIVFLLAAMIIIPVEIGFLKHTANKSNPSQITFFGGKMPHVKLTEFLPNEPDANNWPGGHASGGAALLSLYFIGRQYAPKYRYAGFLLGLSVSQLMGFVQVMRGQHFLSHNLWTVWFAWLTLLIMYYCVFDLQWSFKSKLSKTVWENPSVYQQKY